MLPNDPWKEPKGVDRALEIRRDLTLARRDGDALAGFFPSIKHELSAFSQSLGRLIEILDRRPDAWRGIRSIIVIDIPTAISVLSEAVELPVGAFRDQVVSELAQALSRITAGVSRIEESVAADLSLTLSVRNDAQISADPSPQPETEQSGGMFGRLNRLKNSAGQLAGSAASDAGQIAGDAYEVTSGAAGTVAARAGAVASLAGEELTSTLSSAARSVTRPVTNRIQAAAAAASDASMVALILGGVASVVIPPLAPLVVGEAVLGMGEGYARHLAVMDEADAREALRRSGEREDRISEILAAVKGGPVRFETDYISITVDPISGEKSGIVLQGQHMGKELSSIDASDLRKLAHWAPDQATARALSAWMG
jgi:hypothetical protein